MSSGVAVVVTCFNHGRTVEEAVESVLVQTRAATELLIVNDGSTSVVTLQALARLRDRSIRIVSTPNRGVSAARNMGIALTTCPLVVLLDADDWLDPTYIDKAADRLDNDPNLSFVSSGMDCFGAANEIWFPSEPDLIASMTHGVVHTSSMFRRLVWETVGRFDEGLNGHEDVDFWTSVLERGFRGTVLQEPLLHYRVASRSLYRSSVQRDRHLQLMERLYRKHLPALLPRARDLMVEKERFILDQRDHHERLNTRRRGLEAELADLERDISETLDELASLGGRKERVRLGDLRRTTPVSPVWGLDRGMPLDRYYIHAFLDRWRLDVTGRVLEVKDNNYTRAYGEGRVTRSDVLDIDAANPEATIVADLARAPSIAAETFDCVILTQTLGLIFDAQAAVREVHRILKPGGVVLCTVPASGRISYEEPALDGDFWRFTEASARALFAGAFAPEEFQVSGFGNVLASVAFLHGLAPHELTSAELNTTDPYFPVVYGIRAVKRQMRPDRVHHSSARTDKPAAVLMYHRVSPSDPQAEYCVDPLLFRSQLHALRAEGFDVMPLGALVDGALAGHLDRPSVALTFDDGYRDGLEIIAPMLAEHHLPATFFVVGTALDGAHEFWWDLLDRIFRAGPALPPELRIRLGTDDLVMPTATKGELTAARTHLTEQLYTLPLEARDAVVARLREWGMAARAQAARLTLTAEQVAALATLPNVEIGAHSDNHLWLPTQTPAVRFSEVSACKARLEGLMSRPVVSFSYPFGGHDEATVAAVRAAGYRYAVTTEEHSVGRESDPWRIPRIEVGNWGAEALLERFRRVWASDDSA